MSLVKVPVIVLVSYAFKKCLTPPNPAPPKDSERLSTNFMEVEWYTQRFLPIYAMALQFIAAIAEIATIVAWNNPTSPISKATLSFLVFREGQPSHLRLTPLNVLGATMIVAGTLLRLRTFRYLGRFFHFEASIQRDHELIVSGPYSIVRHPSYTGMLISHPGWFLWQLSRGSWVRESGLWSTPVGKVIVLSYAGSVILGSLYLALMRMSNEDDALRRKFGKKWEDWAKDVPYCIMPGIY